MAKWILHNMWPLKYKQIWTCIPRQFRQEINTIPNYSYWLSYPNGHNVVLRNTPPHHLQDRIPGTLTKTRPSLSFPQKVWRCCAQPHVHLLLVYSCVCSSCWKSSECTYVKVLAWRAWAPPLCLFALPAHFQEPFPLTPGGHIRAPEPNRGSFDWEHRRSEPISTGARAQPSTTPHLTLPSFLMPLSHPLKAL